MKPKIFFLIAICIAACNKDGLLPDKNNVQLFPKLSDYNIYQGDPGALVPNTQYKLYELSSQLFSDYAEKQRLIKIPSATKLQANDDGLLDFPDSTIIVKTFYYYLDKRQEEKGKKIIETRILLKRNGLWNVGTYLWNDQQSEAYLVTPGLNKTVNYIDDKGAGKVISYHVPSNRECASCHNSGNTLIPIGPKVRNLNFNVVRNGNQVNQLTHLQAEGILSPTDPSSYGKLPAYTDISLPLEQRARAYLDVNCAHCHSDKGLASSRRYRLDYHVDLSSSKIKQGKSAIAHFMDKGLMPKIGTTVIDKEGVALIKKYLNTL